MTDRLLIALSAAALAALSTPAHADQRPVITLLAEQQITWTNSMTSGVATVEFSTNLLEGHWLPATHALTTGTVTTAHVPPLSTDIGFYRISSASLVGCPTGMALVPSGWFQMGDSLGDGTLFERPPHPVYGVLPASVRESVCISPVAWSPNMEVADEQAEEWRTTGGDRACAEPV